MEGPLQKRGFAATEVVQGSQGQGRPLQHYEDSPATLWGVVFYPSDTKQ